MLLQDKRVDPSDLYDVALQNAIRNGHKEIVEMLLQDERVDASPYDNFALGWQ
jgi:hypothetical protein